MAQAVFGDHHPVQDYLREETGEDDAFDATGPFFPGIHPTFDDTIYPLPPWDLRFFAPMFGIISATVRKERLQRKAAEEFAELFKYKLVSSPLLSSGRGGTTTPSATATPTAFGGGMMMMGSPNHGTYPLDLSRSSFISATSTAATTTAHNQRSEIPGRWNKPVPIIVQHHEEDDTDADSTTTEDDSYFSFNTLFGSMTLDYHTWSHHTLPPFPLICLVILVILKFPFILAPFSLLFLPFLSVHALEGSATSLAPVVEQDSYTDTLNSLDALIHASQTWDQTTLHAITLLLPPSSTSSSPLFPSPPLAHSLHTTLVQTSTHVNTIRSLLSALARSSKELQMLERMYGPQSPALLGRFPATGTTENGNRTNGTPTLLRSPSMPYTATNRYQPQTSPSSSRRPSSVAGHESMMTRSLGAGGSAPLAQSPSTTTTPSKHLSHLQRSSSVNSFHIALSPPTSSATSPMSAPTSPFTRYTPRRRSISKPSSLTNVRSNSLGGNGGGGFDRDTLSGASLGQFRDTAKSAIRHTAGCLLGLRFLEGRRRKKRREEKEEVHDSLTAISSPSSSRPTLGRRPSSHSFDSLLQVEEEEEVYDTEEDGHLEDDQDPSYWEDVRSVLALFRSALEDASDRLQEAIGDHQRGASALPSPPPSSPPILYPNPPSHSHLLPTLKNDETADLLETLRRRSRTSGGRDGFAPIPSALGTFLRHVDGMQDALSEVNISLKEAVEGLASSSPSPSSTHGVEKAYERVRTALGIALRECERGRGALGDHLRPAPPPSSVVTIPEEEDQRPDTPPLIGGDGEDDEGSSAEADVACTSPPPSAMTGNAMIIEGNHHEGEREGGPSLHTLLAEALLSIPPTGKEQVFEAETTTPTPNASPPRTITKLSRAERIQQVKAQRAAPPPPPVATTGMGPSTDVVQELKDVIWQVGERRRRSGLMMSSFRMVEEEDEEEPTRPPGLDGDEQYTQKQIQMQTRPLSY